MKAIPSPDTLRVLLRYEAETGKMFWRERPLEMFKNTWGCTSWNARYSESEAGTIDPRGYRRVSIFGQIIMAHRVAWAIHHGEWPRGEIDHINHDCGDNRVSNLRVVSHSENGRNTSMQANNTSGVCGVCWHKYKRQWQAKIMIAGKLNHLGYFDIIAEAAKARAKAERELGFHRNHGATLGAASRP